MAESDMCASVADNALMVIEVVSSRPSTALQLNSNVHDKYTCACTGKVQQHLSPVLMQWYGAGTRCSSSCKFAVSILCRPYTALKASFEAVRSSYHRGLHRQLPPGPTRLQQGWQGGPPCLTGHLALPADSTQSLPCIDRRALLQPCQESLHTLPNPVCICSATKHVGTACSNIMNSMHDLLEVLLQTHATSIVKEASIEVESAVGGSDLRGGIAQAVTHVATAC